MLESLRLYLIFPLALVVIFAIPKISGIYYENQAQQFSDEQKNLPLEEKTAFIKAHLSLCQSFKECARVSSSQDFGAIVETCSQTLDTLQSSPAPLSQDPTIEKANKIYWQSMVHSTEEILEYPQARVSGHRRVGVLGLMKRWTIDTCSYDSVPQKLYRSYGIKPSSGDIVTCSDLETALERKPASL